MVNNGVAEAWDSDNLSDNDPATDAIVLSGNAIIYGNLQKLSTPGCFVLSGKPDAQPVKVQIALEVSSDLKNWTTVLGEEASKEAGIPGFIALPADINPWRYFRLTIESEKSIALSEFGVAEGDCSPGK